MFLQESIVLLSVCSTLQIPAFMCLCMCEHVKYLDAKLNLQAIDTPSSLEQDNNNCHSHLMANICLITYGYICYSLTSFSMRIQGMIQQ